MKTGIGQSKYSNWALFHVVWSGPCKSLLDYNDFNISYESLEKINVSLWSFETGNLSADNFKNTRPRWVDSWARGTVRW